jgi:hypothetical protein
MNANSSVIIVAAVGLAFVAGLILFIRGWRGRRVGDEPRCRKCGYNLTGLTSENCPECGTAASGANVVRGQRRRRRGALVSGLVLLAISVGVGGTAGYLRGKRVDWYAHLPVFVLTHQAQADDLRAVQELARRLENDQISADAVLPLVPYALEQHALHQKNPRVWAWTRMLARLERAGRLAPAQSERLRDQATSVELSVRPHVRQGEDIAVSFTLESQPLKISGQWTGKLRLAFAYEGRLITGTYEDSLGFDGYSVTTFKQVPTAGLPPGRYQLVLRGDKVFHKPDFTRPVRISAEVEVLPPTGAETVHLVRNPALANEFRRVISLSDKMQPCASGRECIRFELKNRMPMDWPIEFVARVGEREIHLGGFCMPKVVSGASSDIPVDRAQVAAPSFTLLLRTDAEAARATTDMLEIWDGELDMGTIEIPAADTPGATQSAETLEPEPARPWP